MKISAKQIGHKSESTALNAQWKFSFEVSDSGIGISEHDLKNIFDTFKQTDHGKYLQGSGLGLSISRQFARMMAGDVSVSSKLGEGSTFLVEVQMMEVEANVVAALKDHELVIALKAGQPTYRILVVDDVLEIRQLLVNLLESVGLEVRAAENGAVAIAIYQEWLPHLILMDISMPVMDGYEAIRQIRAIPAETSTKIIALTASAFDSDRRTALEAGCDDFVVKPFTEAIVFDKIGNLLGAEYVYAESLLLDIDNINLQAKSALNPLTKTEMQSLDRELVNSIHQATLLLDESTLHELIDLIPANHKSIAQILSIMVDNLQFESILKLTQP